MRTDVLSWDDQVALFELAMKKFDSVDVVVSSYLPRMAFHLTSVRLLTQV